jgi:hypothetical protein
VKNNLIGLFISGIITGGAIMFILLGFSQIPNISFSEQTVTSIQTSDHLPYLIALEPTHIPQQATRIPTSIIIPTELSLAPIQIVVHSTPTPLSLVNEQRPEVIGYSVEGRPLNIYSLGSGELQRVIVAGIHGGDEWNTITLANQLIEYLNQNHDGIPDDVTF